MSMGDALEPLRRDSTPERIASQLRLGIVTGRLPPGQALREIEVARQLGVSRGPVREAFQRLIQEGLLEAHPARGVFVPQLTAADIADLYLARGAVETTAARLLATSGTAEALHDLSAALAELEAAPEDDWNELVSLDLHLHEVLVRGVGSMRLGRMFDTLAAETRLCMVALESFYPERADLVTEHAEIVQAIRRGDAAAAASLLDRHMADSVRRLTGGTEPPGPTAGLPPSPASRPGPAAVTRGTAARRRPPASAR
jgi:DNA-binding GntR family transcriptional regulator